MALDIATKRTKKGIAGEFNALEPLDLLICTKAFRMVRRRYGLHNRCLELLMAVDALCVRNEREWGEYSTCRAELSTLTDGIIHVESFARARAVLSEAGFLTWEPCTRWTWKAKTYTLTRTGREIIKEYRATIEELRIQMNTAKVRK